MQQCNFNKIANNFIEIGLRHECSPVNLLHFLEHFFPGTHLGGFCPLQVFSLGLFPIFFPEAY